MLERRHVAELWKRMASMYGHAWVSAHGETDADDTWLRGLKDLNPRDLADGLSRCLAISRSRAMTGDEDWPPTLGTFRAYCQSVRMVPSHVRYVALPKPELTPAQKAEAIAGCRRALGQS